MRAEYAGDGVVSLALRQEQGGSGLLAQCASREGSAPPTLEVELGPPSTLPVVSVVGDPADAGTSALATVDGDLGTRWSNADRGGSITWDLGAPQTVAGIELGFYQGATRSSLFELHTSVDGVTWTTVDAGHSRGRGEQLEIRIWGAPVLARYVRYLGFGNSDSGWNSLTEVVIVGG